ncbi:MAG: hypothetical protein PHR16_13400 [Methylovulum sp.]|nr:hypothetical protein [Methylovulum sp.]
MQSSCRNHFLGTVSTIRQSAVNKVGEPAYALIKASHIILAVARQTCE